MRQIEGKHSTPRRRKKRRNKDILIAVLAVIAVAAVIVAIWAVATRNQAGPEDQGQKAPEETAEPVEKLTDSIELPGYGALYFKADATEQDVRLPNPEQNFCYIQITLMLEDGTELWKSGLIAPGEQSEPIVFSQPLAAGEYKNAVLQYSCFRMDEAKTPLNGATTNLTLKVK